MIGRVIAVLSILVFVLLSVLLGWWNPPRDWKSAVGWDRIPENRMKVLYSPEEGGPEIFWLGHAGFLVSWMGETLLLDPNLSNRTLFVRRHMMRPVPAEELPPISAALISHAHFDHLDLPTLRSIPELASIVVPEGTERYLSGIDPLRTAVKPLGIWETISVGPLAVTAVPAIHGGGRWHPLHGRLLAVGYVISNENQRIYFSGDTADGPHIEEIAGRFSPDIAILPVGGYSPRLLLKYHHLNPVDAVSAARRLGSRLVIPAHFGTFRVSLDRPASALPWWSTVSSDGNVAWAMPVLLSTDSIKRMVSHGQH